MIRRQMILGNWIADFFFAENGYDEEVLLDTLRDMGAPKSVIRQVLRKIDAARLNEGFTWSNPSIERSIVVIGPTSSGKEFINTFVHEIRHLADDIGWYLGYNLRGEPLAYLSGDSAMALAELVCELGCSHCRVSRASELHEEDLEVSPAGLRDGYFFADPVSAVPVKHFRQRSRR